MKLTRNGIAYDLEESPYYRPFVYNITESEECLVVFNFSSELYAKKFTEQRVKNREKIEESLTNRFGLKISNDLLADIVLYSKIEKRGFLILINGDKAECLKDITLDGKNPIMKI